jgi:hypothetical protein
VARVIPVQMWQGRAQSRCRCGPLYHSSFIAGCGCGCAGLTATLRYDIAAEDNAIAIGRSEYYSHAYRKYSLVQVLLECTCC